MAKAKWVEWHPDKTKTQDLFDVCPWGTFKIVNGMLHVLLGADNGGVLKMGVGDILFKHPDTNRMAVMKGEAFYEDKWDSVISSNYENIQNCICNAILFHLEEHKITPKDLQHDILHVAKKTFDGWFNGSIAMTMKDIATIERCLRVKFEITIK